MESFFKLPIDFLAINCLFTKSINNILFYSTNFLEIKNFNILITIILFITYYIIIHLSVNFLENIKFLLSKQIQFSKLNIKNLFLISGFFFIIIFFILYYFLKKKIFSCSHDLNIYKPKNYYIYINAHLYDTLIKVSLDTLISVSLIHSYFGIYMLYFDYLTLEYKKLSFCVFLIFLFFIINYIFITYNFN